MDWSKYPNFTEKEFKCSHTGKCEMRPEFMEKLQALRLQFNRPLIISSGYRDITHPIEAAKESRGEHTYGCAADIAIRGTEALRLIALAYDMGFRRIGINQKGDGRFVHLGMGDKLVHFPEASWSY
jgi:uncharacterized protein YcbK (DUF882 family)